MDIPKQQRVPYIRCGLGACLHADREGGEIILYQSDHPERTVRASLDEYQIWAQTATPLPPL